MRHSFSIFLITLIPFSLFGQSNSPLNFAGTWTKESSTGFDARAAATSCTLNGKIYVIGGFNGNKYNSTLEVFDPVLNSWSTIPTTGTFTPRRGPASNVVDGKIYVMGGSNYEYF